MWDEPFDPNLIGKADLIILCHTLEETEALSKILRAHDVRWSDGRQLEDSLCWGWHHRGKDPIAYRVTRFKCFGWGSYAFYEEDPDNDYVGYRMVTFHDILPELDMSSGTVDHLLV